MGKGIEVEVALDEKSGVSVANVCGECAWIIAYASSWGVVRGK